MRSLVLLFFLYVLPAAVTAQEDSTVNEPSSSLLWEISRSDISFKSYLFGTNHLVSSAFIDTSAVMINCISNAEVIITEIENMKIDTAFLVKAMTMKKNDHYSFSDPDDEEYMVNFFRNNPMLKAFADNYFILKPMAYWLIYFYSNFVKGTATENSSFTALDSYFMQEAQKKNKELKGLETTEEQISYFMDSIKVDTQLKILLETIRASRDDMNKAKVVLDTCYLSQDLSCMSNIGIFGRKFGKENRLFLDNRNLLWIKKLPSYINYRPAVIAVGAGHLPGEYGLLSLLKKQGYTVKAVRF